ncbi:hypothetical protein [Parendozoicomonas sp. Alg238-R29]|uniref:hypothetical protein n=1 Tax=Parendozoicomonas sp. Alg238-R29 TaxID=2993446 RepID=UPI00248E5395|nr:hypothetical protein [Parendozoicomonas sp. Alg238-R29]
MSEHIIQQPTGVSASRSRLLQNTLLINAFFSCICSLSMLIYSTGINAYIGSKSYLADGYLMGLGGVLVFFAVSLFIIAMRPAIHKGLAQAIILLDTLWVIASIILIALQLSPLTLAGEFIIAAIALIVAILAYSQWYGLKHP